jgi:tRNA(Ile2) C34 agmatinyltransferase TiaS
MLREEQEALERLQKNPRPFCPRCGNFDLRPSWPVWSDWFLRLLNLQPFRCKACGKRFHRFRPATGMERSAEPGQTAGPPADSVQRSVGV